ncbi:MULTISPECIES: DUF2586 domain-containing protein [Pseudomonas]|uniref:DUF2586 domain-containing protein n=1 Tax=Pseudomonas TaxID=286 RepID=UPI0005A8F401|nr:MULTISPECIES: DUF2586 domain-containing protein [Pseudomonas]AZD95320.1 Phage protein [Pseudomonas chlororaphis subsp. aureofaciens]KAB0523075.1 DUF2586 family protein [Pseudomonas chlororaphis subsp. aureofaciens]TSD29368.1 DUF2586 family protein [Pseudomonas sp. ATCC 13985]WDG47830.1 DUF2586 domain-containing protein [Pseudomonas chlororaphis]WDG59981.1 DUF2586 domain-containing protein [Pseudomonas chlororaphis]
MALGQVTVNNLNQGQGPVAEIERYFLFIGPAGKNVDQLIPLNTDSDLNTALGVNDSDLKLQVSTARLNGGQKWACMAAPIGAEGNWQDALEKAQQQGVSVEGVVITKPVATSGELTAMHDAAIALNNKYGRRTFVLAASAGILPLQTWADYLKDQKALVQDLAAPRVVCVPQLHGNDLGVLAGRLVDAAVSIADSPMRVATGPLLGLGPVPQDAEKVPLPSSIRAELDKARLSVTQTYPDYPGVYFGDANMLDTPGSDFQVIEHLRLADKAARQIRPLLIRRVADRRLNSSPNSMALNTNQLMAPLRRMAKSARFAGQVFPGEIEPPKDGDLVLVWKSKTEIEVFVKLTPLNNPKSLTANIALDLSTEQQE